MDHFQNVSSIVVPQRSPSLAGWPCRRSWFAAGRPVLGLSGFRGLWQLAYWGVMGCIRFQAAILDWNKTDWNIPCSSTSFPLKPSLSPPFTGEFPSSKQPIFMASCSSPMYFRLSIMFLTLARKAVSTRPVGSTLQLKGWFIYIYTHIHIHMCVYIHEFKWICGDFMGIQWDLVILNRSDRLRKFQ